MFAEVAHAKVENTPKGVLLVQVSWLEITWLFCKRIVYFRLIWVGSDCYTAGHDDRADLPG